MDLGVECGVSRDPDGFSREQMRSNNRVVVHDSQKHSLGFYQLMRSPPGKRRRCNTGPT